jgi:hypothetical protein
MSMSTSVKLLKSRHDLEYKKNLKVLVACQEAGVELPKEIDEYFGGDGVDNDPEYPLVLDFKPRKYNAECADGYEIDVSKLPSGTKTIRFINSY